MPVVGVKFAAMWRTGQGERILRGTEAELFRYACRCLLEAIETYDNGEMAESGVPLFDQLGQAQKPPLAPIGFSAKTWRVINSLAWRD